MSAGSRCSIFIRICFGTGPRMVLFSQFIFQMPVKLGCDPAEVITYFYRSSSSLSNEPAMVKWDGDTASWFLV